LSLHSNISFAINLIPRPCGRRKTWPGYEASLPYLHTFTRLMQPSGTLLLATRPQLSILDTWKKITVPSFLAGIFVIEPIEWGGEVTCTTCVMHNTLSCIHVHIIHVHMYICKHIHIVHMYICTYVYTYICVHVHMCTCGSLYMYIGICHYVELLKY